MRKRSLTILMMLGVAAVTWFGTARAQQTQLSTRPAEGGGGGGPYAVSTHVLPGQISLTLIYITDTRANKLYIYRAGGRDDTSFNNDPELYRTYDLTSAGQPNLQRAQ
jgi:hypothetical protein